MSKFGRCEGCKRPMVTLGSRCPDCMGRVKPGFKREVAREPEGPMDARLPGSRAGGQAGPQSATRVPCSCGCGAVVKLEPPFYFSKACKQRAYRKRLDAGALGG